MAGDKQQKKQLAGYADRLNVRPGETVNFKVSAYSPGSYDADLVRVICGDAGERGAGFKLEEINAPFAGSYEGREQLINIGSCASADMPGWEAAAESFSFACAIWPTMLGKPQAIMMAGAIGLYLNDQNCLTLKAGDIEVAMPNPLPQREWSIIAAIYDAGTGRLTLTSQSLSFHAVAGTTADQIGFEKDITLPALASASATFAAARSGNPALPFCDHFNGKIDRPRLYAKAIAPEAIEDVIRADVPVDLDGLLGFWDFGSDVADRTFADLSQNHHDGVVHQLPTRAVTGLKWDGQHRNFQDAPAEYTAIHFHDSDIYDAGWDTDFSFTVPDGLRSGIYAARLRRGDETEYLTFFVTPAKEAKRAKIAFLASTATYLAYANERVRLSLTMMLYGASAPRSPEDQMLLDHPEFGYSQYEHHHDRSGVHMSSHLRPLMNMRPGVAMWSMNADTNITNWLESRGYDYDLITDHDLHAEGADALAPYDVIITGAHPEYYSTAMLDGVEDYLGDGGRFMYMGGNGFYWRIAISDQLPGAIEVRRAEDGTRAWESLVGEYYQQLDGEYGGLWRRQNRAPNKLMGVGFAAQGFDGSSHYRRTPGADDPRAAFIMAGVDDEIIGDFGSQGGGAAGEEIDRCDFALGSPTHALVLASSENHKPGMLRVKEEFLTSLPHGGDPKVRADLTFFETEAGGAVFSTGSISWAGSLAHADFDNNVARITENVLNRFVDPTPFEFPG